jgi:nicotinic acid phosphoribosyltransferase
MNQLITEDKFIEGIKQSILYGNREFLRSFQLRLEIKECNSSNSSNQDKNTVDTTVACLAPPFQNIGFLETKWLEIIKELVQHGNKNILKNVELQLVMEERTDRVD